jgi:hypothetical protein
MTTRTDYIQPQVGPMGFAGTMKTIGRVVTLTAADLVTGNIVKAFRVPAGFTVLSLVAAVFTDMDSGATLLISVGDAVSGTRFLSSDNSGQAGGTRTAFTTPTVGTNTLFLYTVDTDILVTITAQGTASVAGTLTLYLSGFIAQ